jgi:hypothetical protein
MRNRFLVYLVVNLILFLIVATPWTYKAQEKEAGKIEKIDCEKPYWRKTATSKEDPLTKKDEGRTLYVDEGVRCVGKGAVQLLDHGQPISVDDAKGWYNLPETNAGDESGTGGRRGEEELTWMKGTYRLNKAESDTSVPEIQFFKQSIKPLWQDEGLSNSAPVYFAFKPENKKLTFSSSDTPPVTFSTDGQMRTASLNSGDVMRLQATPAKNQLDITWMLNDVTVLVNVRPQENGQRLILNWTVHTKSNPTPQKFKTIYEREYSEAYFDIYKPRRSDSKETAAAVPGGRDEMIVVEILEPISLKPANPTSVKVRIIKPDTFYPIIGIEVKTQPLQTAQGLVVALQFYGKQAYERVEPLTVALERVVTADGAVLVKGSAIQQQVGNPTTVVLPGNFELPAGARFILRRL